MKKNKSILLSTPYLIWMVVFTLIPLGVVCYYALTDPSTGEFSLVNLRGLNLYWGVLWQSICLRGGVGFHLPAAGLPHGLLHRPPKPDRSEVPVYAGDAAHVHELPAPYPRMGRTCCRIPASSTIFSTPSASAGCGSSVPPARSFWAWCITICPI